MTDNMDELNDKFKKSAENFSLIPPAKIWRHVEADIHNRERKRRFIIFLFMGAVILSGGLLVFINYLPSVKKYDSLDKNQPALLEERTTQSNSTDNKCSSLNKEVVVPQMISENKNQTKENKGTPEVPQSATPVSNSYTYHIKNIEAQATPTQNDLSEINLTQEQITSALELVNSAVVTESIKRDSSFEDLNSTLSPVTHIDSLITLHNDSIPKAFIIINKDSIKAGQNNGKWTFAIGAAPTLSYTKQDETGDYQIISNYRDSSDKNRLTWNYHFAINYKVLPELEIFTGVGIINFEQEILSQQAVYHYDTSLVVGPQIIPIIVSRDYFNIQNDSTKTVKNKFSWLEIPVGIRYNFLPNHKFNIAIQPEVSFNRLIHAEGFLYNSETLTYEEVKNSDVKTWLVSYGVGISFQYAILKSLGIEVTPYYKNFGKSIYRNGYPVSQRLQQIEFRLSLKYMLK